MITKKKKKFSIGAILLVLFGIAITLGVFVIILQGVQKQTDLRSQAGLYLPTLKLWEFKDAKGNDSKQNWVQVGLSSYLVKDGIVSGVTIPTVSSVIFTNSMLDDGGEKAIQLSRGTKQLRIRMQVDPIKSVVGVSMKNPIPTYVLKPFGYVMNIRFYQKQSRKNKKTGKRVYVYQELTKLRSTIPARASEEFQEYSVNLPDTLNAYSFHRIQIAITGLNRIATPVRIDWIKLLGAVKDSKTNIEPLPPGCEYEKVECRKAPCDPIISCPDDGISSTVTE